MSVDEERPELPWGNPDGRVEVHLDEYLQAHPEPSPKPTLSREGIARALRLIGERMPPLAPWQVHVAEQALGVPVADGDDVLTAIRRAASRMRVDGYLPRAVYASTDVFEEVAVSAEQVGLTRTGLKVWGLDVVESPHVPPGRFYVLPRRPLVDPVEPLRLTRDRSGFDPFDVVRFLAHERLAFTLWHPRRRTWSPAQQRAAHAAYRAKTRRRNRRRSR